MLSPWALEGTPLPPGTAQWPAAGLLLPTVRVSFPSLYGDATGSFNSAPQGRVCLEGSLPQIPQALCGARAALHACFSPNLAAQSRDHVYFS